jgi:acyl-CoA synthetase (AMP-forming)/AMP-acid ligase II
MSGGSLQAEILTRLGEGPGRPCVTFYGPDGAFRWQTREEVYLRAAAAAGRLSRSGLRPGDVCVIVLPSGETAAKVLLASLLLGAVPLLVAPPTLVGANLDVHSTVRSALRRASARVLVYASSAEAGIGGLAGSFPATRFLCASAFEPAEVGGSLFEPARPRGADVAVMQLTSGTTAEPRICVWDHQGVLAALEGMASAMALSPDDVCVNWTPLYHDMGLVNNFFLCLARGVPLVMLSPHDFIRRPALWLRCLSDTRATITWAPNFGYAVASNRASDSELAGVRLDGVRAFWNAAERIHLETLEAFHRRFAALGVRYDALKTNFGCAENIGGATFSALDGPARREVIDRRLLDERGVARPAASGDPAEKMVVVGAGRAHPGLRIQILSPRGRQLPDGRVGEICLDTPSHLLRYQGSARETRRALGRGLLRTGDLGYLRDGELFWVGRLRDRITIHGKKIDPSAFEAVLASTPGLREGCFAAFGVPDERLGTERLIVVSEARPSPTESIKELEATIRRRFFLEMGVTPDDIVLVRPGTLAKTSSGKRRHRHFRKLYLSGGLEQARKLLADSMPGPAEAVPRGPTRVESGEPVQTPV